MINFIEMILFKKNYNKYIINFIEIILFLQN